jgi:hypothetical protein
MKPISINTQTRYDYPDGVFITFENGSFHHATFPFRGQYTREQWRKLAEIEAEILRIEKLNTLDK